MLLTSELTDTERGKTLTLGRMQRNSVRKRSVLSGRALLAYLYLRHTKMAATASAYSTPVNKVDRKNLIVLIRNNILNNSIEFVSDTELMDTDSPIRKPKSLQPVIKKLFHSPMADYSPKQSALPRDEVDRAKRARKRKQLLIPDSNEKIKRVYVKECDSDSYSPELCGGMRRRMLISLFHNKEYSMDCGD
ncbi:unnamed protein product [Parnassius mnemosyne]|uniref:Uncharacterized protein n=1 Tax=Parnassius mnemosyne TaxID=213953 RepID=A0AAV1LI46_9NEOP